MKAGITLVDMARELERQREIKKDYVAPTQQLQMQSDGKRVAIAGNGLVTMTNHAKRQLAAKLEIPATFYDRLEEKHPSLLASTVNTFFQKEPSRFMVRTLDLVARAFLSNRFRALDNYDLFEAVFPVIKNSGAIVESCQLTETKLYIKCRLPWLDRELPIPEGLVMGVGHNFFVRKIEAAVTIANSEVGAGRIMILPGTFEKQCTNLATYKDEGFGKLHVGKAINDEGDDVQQYLSDETRRIRDAAVWAEVRDVLTATMDGRVMDNIVAKLTAARGDVVTGDPAKVVEVFAKQNRLTDDEKGGLLRYFVESGEMTRYGLQWGVTRLAGEVEDYDRASELERLGGQVIELPRSDWQVLAKAA